MAPKGRQLKRKSSAGGEPALKRQMLEDSKAVAAAVKKAALPPGVIHLLSEAVPPCLSTFADQRHRYQESVVEMVGQALGGIEEAFQTAVTEASTGLDSLDRAQLQTQIVEQAKTRAAAKTAEAQKEATVVEASLKFRLADEALKAKIKEQKAGDSEYNAVDAKKAKVADAIEKFAAAKAAAASKKAVASLESALKAVDVDASLLGVLPNVIAKEPAERGEFDGVMLSNLDSELAKKLETIEAELAPLAPAKEGRASEVAAAQAAYDAAKEARDAAKAEFKDATAAVHDADKSLKAAEEDEKDFANTLKAAKSKKEEAEKELSKFREGPLACFTTLKVQTTPPPPPPEPEKEEAPAEGEAPAEAHAAAETA